MSNPFKTGDKVVRLRDTHDNMRPGDVGTVIESTHRGVRLEGGTQGFHHQPVNLRAAIAGQDYPAPCKFKVGDKVTYEGGWTPERVPMNVTRVEGDRVWTDNCVFPGLSNPAGSLCMYKEPPAAPLVGTQIVANIGHLADGSGVQKHSAGPIYPCVIVLRDKRLKGTGLFDYGLTSPRNHAPVWFSTLEAAHAVADIINKDIAP